MSANVIISPYPTAGSGALSPGSFLAGYNWDIDPDAISGANNDPVVDAPDISGAGLHYGQNTTLRQPTLKVGLYNSHNAIRFGANKCLVPDPSARDFGTANTLICVCTPSSVAEYIFGGSGAEGRPAFLSAFAAAFEYWNKNSGSGERSTFASSASGPHILTLARTDDTGNYVGYFDETQVFSVAVDTSRDWSTHSVAVIGGLTAGSSQYDGDILRIIGFSQNHAGTSGLADLITAIKTYWALP